MPKLRAAALPELMTTFQAIRPCQARCVMRCRISRHLGEPGAACSHQGLDALAELLHADQEVVEGLYNRRNDSASKEDSNFIRGLGITDRRKAPMHPWRHYFKT